ncbi:hypothetical protein HM131_09175 [Halobacillus mangrovi]|uniref:DUF4131 domain-containing protein n=1 Tax=Halobacillus mangrovi TaxID=402384 RepID=A0A1W5ZUQ8_9BACI|nr:hypothetical protein HM131_09175 [Halobacillus mangrovi]
MIGGVLSRLPTVPFYLMCFLFLIWLYLLKNQWMIIFLLTFFMTFGFFYLSPASIPQITSTGGPISLTITSEVEQTSQTIQMVGKLNSSTINEKVLLILYKNAEEKGQLIPLTWKHGADCKVVGERVPIESARNPGQFDYREYMAAKKIYSQLELKNQSSIDCEGRSWLSHGYDLRALILNSVKETVDPIAFKWMAALLFGEKQYLDEGIVTFFQDFNLSHLLAISGCWFDCNSVVLPSLSIGHGDERGSKSSYHTISSSICSSCRSRSIRTESHPYGGACYAVNFLKMESTLNRHSFPGGFIITYPVP